MDISKAKAEPLAVYYRDHETLNNVVKIASLSLDLAEPIVAEDEADATTGILRQPVPPWGFVWSDDISAIFRETKRSFSRLAVVQAYSAFDNFLVLTRAELERWSTKCGNGSITGTSHDEKGNISLARLYQMFDWNLSAIQQYIPLFDFFQECRNCIAHRNGVAHQGLISAFQSEPMKNCNQNWPFSTANDELPGWPEFAVGVAIPIEPKHAILASAVCNAISKNINRLTVETLGTAGMTYMATHHALLSDDHEFRLPSHSSHPAACCYFLSERYYVVNANIACINEEMSRLKIHKEASSRYSKLYPKSKT